MLRCSTVQVKGRVVFRRKTVMHNVIIVSTEMELETLLMPLLGSLLKTPSQNYLLTHCIAKFVLFSFSTHFHAAEELLREQQVWLDPGTATPVTLCAACQNDTYLCYLISTAVCLPDTNLIKPRYCIFTPALVVCGWACCAWITPHVFFSPHNRFTMERLNGLERNKSQSNLYTHNSGKLISIIKCTVEHQLQLILASRRKRI